MLKALYGNLKIKNKFSWIMIPFKIIYMAYTLPFLIIIVLASFRSLGAFGNPLKEEFGFVKRILLHFSAIVISMFGWICILIALHIEVRLHLFTK